MRYFGKGNSRKKQGVMNGLETWYARILEQEKALGKILWYKYEAIKLRLADKTFYTPDFVVMNKDFEIEFHECKGFLMESANIKIKVASETFPFIFKMIRKNKGGVLDIEVIGNK